MRLLVKDDAAALGASIFRFENVSLEKKRERDERCI